MRLNLGYDTLGIFRFFLALRFNEEGGRPLKCFGGRCIWLTKGSQEIRDTIL